MKTYGNEGVTFSDEVFSDKHIAWLMQPPEQMRAEAKLVEPPKKKPPTKHTLESDFDEVWRDMERDPELSAIAEESGFTKQHGLANFAMSLSAPMPVDADDRLADSLKTDYRVEVEDGKYVHRLEGVAILSIPIEAESAKEISLNIEAIMCGAFVVIDLVLIAAAVGGVIVEVDKRTVAKRLLTPLGNFLVALSKKKTLLKGLDLISKIKEAVDIGKQVLEELERHSNVLTIVMEVLRSLSPWKWLQVAVSAAATLLAWLFATAAAAIKKVAALIKAVLAFIDDLIAFFKALGESPPEPAPIIPEPPVPPGPPERPPFLESYYIGNNNTKEIHNSWNVRRNCEFEKIKPEHKVFFDSKQGAINAMENQGYNGCHWCMLEHDTG